MEFPIQHHLQEGSTTFWFNKQQSTNKNGTNGTNE
jgi:hypothetical protein